MRSSAVARLVVMGILTGALVIPLAWVYTIVSERAARRHGAVSEVSTTWGAAQVVGGVILAVPYSCTSTDRTGVQTQSVNHALLLPRNLQIEGSLTPERRRRGIFEVVVYRASLTLRGTFLRPDLEWARPERIDWGGAAVLVGISDPRGLTRRAALTWSGQTVALTGGTGQTGVFASGLRAGIPTLETAAVGAELPFDLKIELNGTRELRFLPGAAETSVALTSPWPHPSFVGTSLPETRRVEASGFSAEWRVQDFGRDYPGRWTTAGMNAQQLAEQAARSTFGVSLVQPVDIYQQAERAVKYAVLFIVLTFLVFFLWEIFSTTLLHPMQYAFVGFALCVYYLLLVSISEHAGFDLAYVVSSGVTTALVAGYARAVLGGRRQGASVCAALITLYAFLYLLLRLEDYSLLAGSVGLFLVLAVVMFVTRRMNWYELKLGGS